MTMLSGSFGFMGGVSNTFGVTWTQQTSVGTKTWRSIDTSTDGTKVLAAAYLDTVYSSNSGVSFSSVKPSVLYLTYSAYCSSTAAKFIVSNNSNAYPGDDIFFRSADSGSTWSSNNPNTRDYGQVLGMSGDGAVIYANDGAAEILISTNSGASWANGGIDGNGGTQYPIAVSSDGSKAVVARGTGYLMRSVNTGASFSSLTNAGSRAWRCVASSSDGVKIVAAYAPLSGSSYVGGYIYTSTDSGSTWTQRGPQEEWSFIASSDDGTKLIAAVSCSYTSGTTHYVNKIYTSTDSGVTWNLVLSDTSSTTIQCIAISGDGTKLFYGRNGGYIYTSS